MIVFLEGFKSITFAGSIQPALYQYGIYNDLRVLLEDIQPECILAAPLYKVDRRIRVSVGLSEVILFRKMSDTESVINTNELIYLGMFRITEQLELYMYPFQFSDIFKRTASFFNSPEPIILLDLDKTLIITEADAPYEELFVPKKFNPHLTIEGKIVLDDSPFYHRVMFRPGCRAFLKALFALTSKVYIITAGDLYYAESIVHAANACGWGGEGDDAVTFPMSHVYSVRNQKDKALPKSFNRIVPLSFTTEPPKMVAVDDYLMAWDASVLSHVIPINPFEPGVTTENDLVHVLTEIRARIE